MKSIKMSDYFQLKKPQYIYLKITPHKSIRNYNSSNIGKAIAHTYRAINRRIYKQQKKLFFETSFKISYVIDIYEGNANFYFLVPKPFLNLILEKIKEIWAKATVELVEEGLKPFSPYSETYQLSYKKEDALSLQVDKKSNEPLNSILSVIDIMKEEDRVTLLYNFMPCSQLGWQDNYSSTMEKIKDKKTIIKKQMSFEYVVKQSISTFVGLLDSFVQVLNDFTGGNPNEEKESIYKSILSVLDQQGDLSATTKKKKESTILPTQIAVVSESLDDTRRENNAISVCQAFRSIDEDNELVYKKVKENINIEEYDFKMERNLFSTDEISNFIQVPGRTLLTQFGINHIKVEEVKLPKELSQGIKRLGTAKFKGAAQEGYLENDYNNGNLPLVLIGSQGGGKTTYMANYAKDCVDSGESLIVLDFIKSCGLSEDIKKVVPKDRLVEIDLGQADTIQGLGYNEIKVEPTMTPFDKLNLANLQSQQVMALVDSVSIGDPLSSRMRRFLNAAANVVFSLGYSSIKDVLNCLEDFRARERYISEIPAEMSMLLSDEVKTLDELNEYSKQTKDFLVSIIIGTYSSKIEHILDRISMLREDFKIKFMYNKSLDDNINLTECMDQGKIVLIKMKEGDFPTKMQKNILVTYWISKIWLATQIRGMKHDKPLRANILIDEVFQAPTSMKTLEYILPQSRKFGTKFIFSTQYMKQLDTIFETLEASGSSFMMLTGSTEDDFNHFKNKIESFEFEDLRDMEKFSSLNLIKYSGGYASFITKLPKPVNG